MPFLLSRQNNILYLTLDTPACTVNILNLASLRQLMEIMTTLTPKETRAVVFCTAKPSSFINGVGLMMAHTANDYDQGVKAGELPRQAYLAVRNASVPTIAAVRGSCLGCGVEFILNCKYRIAANTSDTYFYMTEMNDFPFIPAFGATYNLTHTIGLRNAVNFLLGGKRWSGQKALEHKLIDAVADYRSFDQEVAEFVERAVAGHVESSIPPCGELGKSEEEFILQTKSRIFQLPPIDHPIYLDCLDLMVRAAQKSHVTDEDRRLELERSVKSAISEYTKTAFAFFYIRQTATNIAHTGERAIHTGYRLSFNGQDQTFIPFQQDLSSCILEEVTIAGSGHEDHDETCNDSPDVIMTPYHDTGDPEASGENVVAVALKPTTKMLQQWPRILYNPLYTGGSRFFELVLKDSGSFQSGRFVGYLMRIGFQVAISRSQDAFGINILLASYFKPLVKYCLQGGNVETINFSLRDFGFFHRPHSLVSQIDRDGLLALLSPLFPQSVQMSDINASLHGLEEEGFEKGEYDQRVVDALCLSLLAAVQHCLALNCLPHPSLVDLAAREVLDFPLRHLSLCKYLTIHRVREIMQSEKRCGDLLSEEEWQEAESFISKGKNFYL